MMFLMTLKEVVKETNFTANKEQYETHRPFEEIKMGAYAAVKNRS
jgi:hypothetical protein